jgi:molecular chaperone DnaK (HSP70)
MDLSSKNQKEILITQSGLLSREEVEKLKEEAIKASELDVKKKEMILSKNKIISHIHSLNQRCNDSKLPTEIKDECIFLVREAEKEIEKEDIATMENLEKQLLELLRKFDTLSNGTEHLPKKSSVEKDVNLKTQDVLESKQRKKDETKPHKTIPFKKVKRSV